MLITSSKTVRVPLDACIAIIMAIEPSIVSNGVWTFGINGLQRKKSLAANKEIEWALNPNAPNDPLVLNTVQGSLTRCISQLHPSPPFNAVPEGEFAGLPSVTADSQHFHMGEGQSSEIIVGDQPVEEQNVIPEIGHHKISSQGNNLQMVCFPSCCVYQGSERGHHQFAA